MSSLTKIYIYVFIFKRKQIRPLKFGFPTFVFIGF